MNIVNVVGGRILWRGAATCDTRSITMSIVVTQKYELWPWQGYLEIKTRVAVHFVIDRIFIFCNPFMVK